MGVAIDDLVLDALLLHEGKGVDDGKKLADVVCAVNGTEMEHLGTCGEIDTLIFHRTRVARACRVYSPSVGKNVGMEWQYGVVTIVRRILHIYNLHLYIYRNR